MLRYALKLSSVKSFFNKIVMDTSKNVANLSPEKEAQLHMSSKKKTPDFSVAF